MRLPLRVTTRTWDLAIAIDLQLCDESEKKGSFRRTINFDLVFWSGYSPFAIMHSSRWVNEVSDVRMIIVGSE